LRDEIKSLACYRHSPGHHSIVPGLQYSHKNIKEQGNHENIRIEAIVTSEAIKCFPMKRVAAYDWFYERCTAKQKEQLDLWVARLRGELRAPFGEMAAKELIVAVLTSRDVMIIRSMP
jgi:hypothetical protein